jgi:ABC-2 type transport system permease protein
MSISTTRVRAVIRKELRDYRRNRSIVATMTVIPLIFVLIPVIQIFTGDPATLRRDDLLGIMLAIPALVPTVIAAYAVVGEREQGTLEPLLTTPIRRDELVLGKALAAMVPTLAVSYAVYGIVVAAIALFARAAVADATLRGTVIAAQVAFTPLLAGWSIWAGVAISARASEVRVAQQLGTLASLPTVLVALVTAAGAVHPTPVLVLGLAAALAVLNVLGWRATSRMLDRERLTTGTS